MPRAGSRCTVRGCDNPKPCPLHKRKQWRSKTEKAERAQRYGPEHRALRAKWAPSVATGRVPCRRASNGTCLEDDPFIPAGAKWHLGHPDAECPAPTGPEHVRCNTSTRDRPERYRP